MTHILFCGLLTTANIMTMNEAKPTQKLSATLDMKEIKRTITLLNEKPQNTEDIYTIRYLVIENDKQCEMEYYSTKIKDIQCAIIPYLPEVSQPTTKYIKLKIVDKNNRKKKYILEMTENISNHLKQQQIKLELGYYPKRFIRYVGEDNVLIMY